MNMQKVQKMFFLALLLVLGLPIFALGQTASEMQELKPAEARAVRASAANPRAAKILVVTMDVEGNFDTVDAAMAKFEREAKAQNLPNANPTGVLILYEDPEGKSQFRMAVGVTLSRRPNVKEPLKVGEYSFTAVRHTVTGTYQKLSHVGRTLEAAVREKAQNSKMAMKADASAPFAVVRILNNPKRVKPAQLQNEVIIPFRAQ